MKNYRWTMVILGVIAFLMVGTMVWASPSGSPPAVPPLATPGLDADKVDGHDAGPAGGTKAQRKNKVLWVGSSGRFSMKALPFNKLDERYLKRKPDTFLLVPGNTAELHQDSVGKADLNRLGRGIVWVRKTGSAGDIRLLIPIPLASLQSGEYVKVTDIRVYYDLDSGSSYITDTYLYSLNTSNGSYHTLIGNGTNRTSTSWASYVLNCTSARCRFGWPDNAGLLTLDLTLHFAGTGSSHDIGIGGVLVRVSYD